MYRRSLYVAVSKSLFPFYIWRDPISPLDYGILFAVALSIALAIVMQVSEAAWDGLVFDHIYWQMEQSKDASLASKQQPQQPADQTGSTMAQHSGMGLQFTPKVPPDMVSAWKWMCKELNDILPGLDYRTNRTDRRAMKASLTSLGMIIFARSQRCGLLNFCEKLYCWAQSLVEMAVEAEPGATATMIALYGLAMSEV